ncbi:MAG: RNA polymerase sigma factor [Candidatus Aminicenantes bacterium]|nr:RNA polymerase sigma factor [Candidatus Aminicenantes bacterium]MDH5383518.1 RNA polymerase sigma factor [Candidatus Aminicenantes bacterium]
MTEEKGRMSHRTFDDLYDQYRTAVYSFSYRLTQNRGEAEDLFQETWLRVAQNFPKVLDMQKVKAWLFTITANLHRDALRKKRIRRLFLFQKRWKFDQDLTSCRDIPEDGSSDRANESEQVDISLAISRAMASLPDQQRLIFVLKEVEGFKQSEIGEILGMPVGTVKSMMYRAVQRLRRDLAAYQSKTIENYKRGPNEMQSC